MDITEVRIKLMEDSDDRLAAFCSITFDNCFVVRDLKIIEGANGPFVAMPSRKLTAHCTHCGAKNHLRSQYCNQCGKRQKDEPVVRDADGRAKLYADIAHPINSQCREMIQQRVIAEYAVERERAQQPGYVSRYDEQYEDAETTSWKRPAAAADDPPGEGAETTTAGESDTGSGTLREESSPPPFSPARDDRASDPPPLPAGSHIEEAEPEPPPPHTSPRASPNDRKQKGGDFGAGIFE